MQRKKGCGGAIVAMHVRVLLAACACACAVSASVSVSASANVTAQRAFAGGGEHFERAAPDERLDERDGRHHGRARRDAQPVDAGYVKVPRTRRRMLLCCSLRRTGPGLA